MHNNNRETFSIMVIQIFTADVTGNKKRTRLKQYNIATKTLYRSVKKGKMLQTVVIK